MANFQAIGVLNRNQKTRERSLPVKEKEEFLAGGDEKWKRSLDELLPKS